MNPERPEIRNSFTPDLSQHPTLLEEIQRRTADTRPRSWRAVLETELRQRYRALQTAFPSEEEFDAKMVAYDEQGEQWMRSREQLGLSIDQVAHRVGLPPWEFMCIELGFPSPNGVPEEAAAKLNSLFSGK